MTKYNHAYTIAFTLVNESPQGEATPQELRAAILKRLASIDDAELLEAVDAPYDTYTVEEA